jgi:hypothetical protein
MFSFVGRCSVYLFLFVMPEGASVVYIGLEIWAVNPFIFFLLKWRY